MLTNLIILLALGFAAVTVSSYLISKQTVHDSIINSELPLTGDNIYSEIQRDLLKPVFISSLMANDAFVREWVIQGEGDVQKISRYLKEIKLKYNTISAFFVSDNTRNYYHSGGILKKVKSGVVRDSWYFRVREMNEIYEINVDPDMANKDTITIFINYKVFDFTGNYIGATGVGLAVSKVKKLIASYRQKYHRTIYFADAKGEIILKSLADDSISNWSHINQIPSENKIAGLSEYPSRTISFEYQNKGKTVLSNARFIPELNWYLIVEQNEDIATRELKKTLYINLAVCFIISLIVFFFARMTINNYQQNLEKNNRDLLKKNRQIDQQKKLLESQTQELAETNKNLQRVNFEKSEFLGIAAHDLKSPLNAIFGFSEMIQTNEKNNDETRKFARLVMDATQNMNDLISNLLDIREMDSMIEPDLKNIDFREAVTHALRIVKYHALSKEIPINYNQPDEPFMVKANLRWLSEIIVNLLSNAIKFSKTGYPVSISLNRLNDKTILEVADLGPGILKSEQHKLFQQFTRLSAKPTAGESSSGLGLYIVKKMITQQGGTVWYESVEGAGSSFFISLETK